MVVKISRRNLLKGGVFATVAAAFGTVTVKEVLAEFNAASQPISPSIETQTWLIEPPTPEELAIREHRKLVAAKQAAWDSLTEPEKRVAVFQDVLDSLRIGECRVKNQVYLGDMYACNLPATVRNDSDAALADAVPVMRTNCHACLLGNLFLAFASQDRSLKFWDFVTQRHGESVEFSGAEGTIRELEALFDEDQLELMEAAFEGKSFYTSYLRDEYERRLAAYNDTDDDDEGDEVYSLPYSIATRYERRYSPFDRIRVVCLNAIRNKGTFIPTDDEPELPDA